MDDEKEYYNMIYLTEQRYIDYVCSVLQLFYSLCKDRNEEGITHIKSVGLS